MDKKALLERLVVTLVVSNNEQCREFYRLACEISYGNMEMDKLDSYIDYSNNTTD